MKKENTVLILKESFFSAEVPDFVAEKTGAKVVEVPVYSEDYIGMMDTIVKKIVMSSPPVPPRVRRRESQTSKIEIPAFAGMTERG
jgi:phosphoribosylcarboxyaminoimidazole (NCAIR) mutase